MPDPEEDRLLLGAGLRAGSTRDSASTGPAGSGAGPRLVRWALGTDGVHEVVARAVLETQGRRWAQVGDARGGPPRARCPLPDRKLGAVRARALVVGLRVVAGVGPVGRASRARGPGRAGAAYTPRAGRGLLRPGRARLRPSASPDLRTPRSSGTRPLVKGGPGRREGEP